MLLWIAAAFLSFYIKGICGFANTLVFTAMLSFTNSIALIFPVSLMLGYPTNAIIAFKERKYIDWKVCALLSALVIAGSIPGTFFLKNSDAGIIKQLFGVVIILLGLENLMQEKMPKKAAPSKASLLLIGVVSGLLCGLYGVGALISAYISRVTDNSHAFKANLCVVFLVDNSFRFFLYIFSGLLTTEVLKLSLLLIPMTLFGLWAGMRSSNLINEHTAKKVVAAALIISGAALIISNF